ncbi:MAG TPA: hypothetical protein VGR07_04495, partial [Thermoanaerobaculia bacterium]|nr:hypothetical protein [Thermoanaerobaculia bacterium]
MEPETARLVILMPHRRSCFAPPLILLALAGALGCAGFRPAPRESGSAARRVRFLELAVRQLRHPEPGDGPSAPRYAAGTVAAAVLAVRGETTSADAGRWAEAALAGCAGRWEKVECEAARLALQRVVLGYPGVLPGELLARVRATAAESAPPPGDEATLAPWDFKETENQRLVKMARSLVAEVVAGTPESPAARAWGSYAAAFLAAHDRDGWYEQESPGYLALSITALLQLADHAPQAEVREGATRQLNVLFAAWAQEQVGGFPAGAKSRTYVHWALGERNTPWQAWAWLAGGRGRQDRIFFLDATDLAVSAYRIPLAIRRLLALRRQEAPYEIRARRSIALPGRRDLDTARYSYATPDYILGAAQSVAGLRLAVSGGQEILATLYAEGMEFAPLYLWSRTRNPTSYRWRTWAGQDFAMGDKNVVLARLGATGEATGHAYLSPPWSQPEPIGDAVVSRYGDTYVALVTAGGWDVARAPRRFPAYYAGDPAFRHAWVAVPVRQPGDVALEVGRRADDGDFQRFKRRAAGLRLAVAAGELRFTASDGRRLGFVPGERATVDDAPIDALHYPLLAGPYLATEGPGRWSFAFGGDSVELKNHRRKEDSLWISRPAGRCSRRPPRRRWTTTSSPSG